ncbi:MAG: hypothetical protein H6668_20840 [Ardenticatenaceae bacterium]|nr:hypothetical protein [Ardenticatenaceae bacterium]
MLATCPLPNATGRHSRYFSPRDTAAGAGCCCWLAMACRPRLPPRLQQTRCQCPHAITIAADTLAAAANRSVLSGLAYTPALAGELDPLAQAVLSAYWRNTARY